MGLALLSKPFTKLAAQATSWTPTRGGGGAPTTPQKLKAAAKGTTPEEATYRPPHHVANWKTPVALTHRPPRTDATPPQKDRWLAQISTPAA